MATETASAWSANPRLLFVPVLLCLSFAANAGPAEDASAFLASQQRDDGAIAGLADIATAEQATSEALVALAAPGPVHDAGSAFLGATPLADQPTEYLARLALVADAVPALAAELVARQNPDGGFGASRGYPGNFTDTAYALQALARLESSPSQAAIRGVGYLLNRQAGNGGWNDSVFATANGVLALRGYRGKLTGVADALTAASSYLLTRRDGGGWTERQLQALAVLALSNTATDPALFADDMSALTSTQAADGSWEGDVYVTALALRAFKAFEARRLGIDPASGTGAVAGRVVRAGTGEPVAGARVYLAAAPDVAVVADDDGRFVLHSVAAITHTLVAEAAGLTPAAVTVPVEAGKLVTASDLVLDVAAATAILTGSALDGTSGQPVAGAQFALQGPTNATVTGDASGNASFPALLPGAYELTVSGDGYRTETAAFSVAGGEVRRVQQLLLPADAYSGDEPVALSLRAVDGETGEPLSGAVLNIADRAVTAGTDGTIHVDALTPGAYDAELSAASYATGRLSFSLPAGLDANLGDVSLQALDGPAAPTTLNLAVTVTSSLDGTPVAGASLHVAETGATFTTDAQGRASINGLDVTEVNLAMSADGFLGADVALNASAFGAYSVDLSLTPASGDPTRTSSTVTGVVSDRATGAPIAGAAVRLAGSDIETVTDAEGNYRLEPVDTMAFALESYASGYETATVEAQVAQHGEYRLDISLQAGAAPSGILIASLASEGENEPGRPAGRARVANNNDAAREILLAAEVLDAEGEPLGSVDLIDPATGLPAVQFELPAGESAVVEWAWNSGHVKAGSYELVLRASEPGTADSARPWGMVLAERSIRVPLGERRQIVGQFHADPPVVQFGTTTPVDLAAFLVNDGNVDLANETFRLRLIDSETGEERFRAEAALASLPLGGHQLLSFGEWLPEEAGDLDVIVEPVSTTVAGNVDGELYVGNKASGALTVSPGTVLPGDRMVDAALMLQGVDVTGGTSVDPLFFAVKDAVSKGADYVAPRAKNWHQRNRCLGCHVQTQSFVGLINADDFRDTPKPETTYLYNTLASSQQPDGEIRISHPGFDDTQLTLAGWALSEADSDGPLYATKYRAAQSLHQHAARSGGRVWWGPDHWTGWWESYEATTYLAVKSLVDTVVRSDSPENRSALRTLERVSQDVNGYYSRDLEISPDGLYLYIARYSGHIDRLELATGEIEPAPQFGGGARPLGVLPAADGSLYVSGINFVHKYLPDGTRIVIRNGGGEYPDILPAPDGGIYVSDRHNRRILHLQDDGSATVIASGGLLNQPYGIEFQDDGGILVGNYGGTNLVAVAPDGSQQLFAEGITQRPLRVQRYGDGFLYTSWNGSLHYVDAASRRVVRYADIHWNTGVTAAGGDAWVVNYNNNHVHRLVEAPLDDGELDAFRADVRGATDWVLNRGNCISSSDVIHRATCLMALGEALRILEDPARIAAAEQRVAEIAGGLRQRQRADGGWGRYPGWASDAIVTALAGLALEYTHPSVDDPVVRNTILYLLDTQRSDGAWITRNNVIGGPPLGATSLVMAYMPKSLLRLGGIDIDVHMTFAGNVEPGAANIAPSEIVPEGELTRYRWSLTGVTSEGREIRFPANMPDLGIGESRPLASRAWLEFSNSFNDDVVRVDLDVPSVKAVSGMGVDVATDSTEYGEQSPVAISGSVSNLTTVAEEGTVELTVRASGAPAGEPPLASLGAIALGAVPANGSLPFDTAWNTGSILPGELEIVATLFNSAGEQADVAVAPFVIARPATAVAADITTDRPVYGGFDTVRLANRVSNITSNAPQRGMRGVLSVTDAAGNEVHARVLDVPALAPSGRIDIPDSFVLQDAPAGEYRAELLVQDAISRASLASDVTTFTVERRIGDTLVAQTEVALPWVYQGDPEGCTDTVSNRGGAALTGVTLIRQLVSMQDGEVLTEMQGDIELAPQGVDRYSRAIETGNLAIGGYLCRLLADLGAGPVQVSAASFGVVEPPIRIAADAVAGERGRLLILLDPACGDLDPREADGGACDADPYGPDAAAPLPVQREHLEAVLTAAGWTYTIVTNAGDFETEFESDGYELYALFNERVKLPEALQHAVVADIEAGRGLLVAGNHDRRNGRLEDALGIKSLGKNLEVDALLTEPFGEHAGGEIDFDVAHWPNAVRPEGADPLGRFRLAPNGNNTPAAEPALTRHAHGEGTGVYAGFDWPAQSAMQGDGGELAGLLTAGLDVAHPAPYAPIAGRVFPVHVLLQNEGIAVPGEIRLALPPGTSLVRGPDGTAVADGIAAWPFALGEAEQQAFTVWLRLPPVAGPLTLEAVIFADEGDELAEHASAAVVLDVQPQE